MFPPETSAPAFHLYFEKTERQPQLARLRHPFAFARMSWLAR